MGLGEFHRRLVAVLDGLEVRTEVVDVDDGSRDGTLFLPGYGGAPVMREFLGDLERERPDVIIDATAGGPGDIPPLASVGDPIRGYIAAHYRRAGDVTTWTVYRRVG